MPTLGAGFDIFKATMSLQKVITRWRSMWTWFHGWISCSWRLSLRIGNFKLQRVRDKRPRCCSPFSELCDMRPEKAVAPHSSTLAWKTPWMEEPGRLQSIGSLRVGHDWATSHSLFTFMHWRRKWQPTPVFLPGESQGQQSLVGCHLWGRTESDMTEAT